MSQTEFSSKWRLYLWPIHGHELRKLFPLFAMFFLVTFNYNILRNAKETLIVTAKHAGAEAIPFIKIWAVLPCAVLMAILYTKLSHRLSRERVFSTILVGFLAFIFLFAFVLHPYADTLHPHAFADWLQSLLPAGAKGFVAMIRYWTLTSFYIMAELWSSTVLSVLLWGFVNEVTSIREAKRFFGIFGIGAHISGIAAGGFSLLLARISVDRWIPFAKDGWSQTLILMNVAVLISGIIILGLFWWVNHRVLCHGSHGHHVDPEPDDGGIRRDKKMKVKMSLRSTVSYLAKSPYLLCIAALVLSYNLSVNLVEVIWKDQVKTLYPEPSAYSAFQGKVTIATDVLAVLTSLFLCGNTIRKFGWTAAAVVTPMIILATSVGFFGFLFLKDTSYAAEITEALSISPLGLVVLFGALQTAFTRAAKFSMFDATKEMAFVPLSRDARLKGKAAIDGVGSRLGKSGSAVLHSALLMTFSSFTAGAPYVAAFLPVVIVVWLMAAKSLGQQFHDMTSTQESLPAPAPVTPAAVPQPAV
jgi:AAA family ATP:ADP antiporter